MVSFENTKILQFSAVVLSHTLQAHAPGAAHTPLATLVAGTTVEAPAELKFHSLGKWILLCQEVLKKSVKLKVIGFGWFVPRYNW